MNKLYGLFSQVLKFNLTESGLLCVLPWLTMAIFANIGGWIADTLVSKGLSITTVRKASKSLLLLLNFFMHILGLSLTKFFFQYFFYLADHAINRVSRSCIFSYTAKSCQNTRHGSTVHGLQSGLNIYIFLNSDSSDFELLCRFVFLNNLLFLLQGCDAFSQSGLYSNHQDIGPRYAVSFCFNFPVQQI
jgi:low temperature requirement protein LtrA